jgi:hypothetical protein
MMREEQHTWREEPRMRKHALGSVVSVLSFVLALAVFTIPPPIVGAQYSEPANLVEARDLFSATEGLPGVRFVHVATAANIVSNWTYIDHPLTNNNPDAIVFVTQNWNPGGVGRTYNNHPIGVWYHNSAKKWAIFNQDRGDMPEGAAFSVLVPATHADAFVHTATGANTVSNWTYIDHPLTNDNPNAMVLVTQNWNPGGAGGTYNDHPIGVWYSNGAKKWAVFNQDLASMPDGAAFNVLIADSGAESFVHIATATNIVSNWTYIDHPLTDHNPNAIVFVTQNWNPGGVGGIYNNRSTGVWYDHGAEKWAIFNQDRGDMPEGAAFNVLIPATHADAFVHTATAANIVSNSTYIDHPLTNDNPNAILLVTQNWNPGGVDGTYNNHPIGVWYSHGAKKWAIFNQDLASMPHGAAFNVLVPAVDASVFVHAARTENIVSNWTYIDHPLTNDRPDAIVFVTQNWNPSGVGNTYNDHPVGVWYHNSARKWAVFNQDRGDMPDGAAFNVLVPAADADAFVHTATGANTVSNWTHIDYAHTNDKPSAIVFVTQNWNPGGVGGIYNNHPIGVWYSDGAKKWAVFNQDLASMPDQAAFNVIVIVYKIYLPIVLR